MGLEESEEERKISLGFYVTLWKYWNLVSGLEDIVRIRSHFLLKLSPQLIMRRYEVSSAGIKEFGSYRGTLLFRKM